MKTRMTYDGSIGPAIDTINRPSIPPRGGIRQEHLLLGIAKELEKIAQDPNQYMVLTIESSGGRITTRLELNGKTGESIDQCHFRIGIQRAIDQAQDRETGIEHLCNPRS